MNRDNLVGEKQKHHENYRQFRQEFPGEDNLAVVVESENMERNRQFIERLAARVKNETNLFTDLIYKPDIPSLGSKALLLAPESDLEELRNILKDFKPFVSEFSKANSLESLFSTINHMIRTSGREQNEQTDSMIRALPALNRIITQAKDSLNRPGLPPSPGIYALFDAGQSSDQQLYLTFDHGRIYLLTARPRNADLIEDAIIKMRQLIQDTSYEVPGLNVGLTGEPVLDYDEMKQSERDAILAAIVSLVLCSLIFIYAYRETGRPLKAVACLIIGLGYSMGFTTLAVGHLNILTITFAPILIGLAIDFGVHYITRYEEEMRRGAGIEEAIEKASVYTGQGIVTGALTTAGAFLAMGFTNFKGIQEMGIISGGGLIACLIPMMTMLPVLLMAGHQNVIDHEKGMDTEKRVRIEKLWLERPGLICLITVALCVASATQFRKVYFDYNLLTLQNPDLSSVVFEEKMINSDTKSLLYAAVVADNAEQARDFVERIRKLPTVATNDNMAEYLTENQTRKLELVRGIKQEVANFEFAEPDTSDVKVRRLNDILSAFMGYMGMAADEAKKQDPKLSEELRSVRNAVADFRKTMMASPEAPRRLADYQTALFDDLRNTFDALKNQDASGPLTVSDLPPFIRNRFIGKTGKQLIQVYPKKDVWVYANQREFINELRQAIGDPYRVTGTPVQLFEFTTLLKNSYQEAAWYSLIAICIMVFLHFRSITCVILSLIPVAIGSIWTLGLMGKTDTPFNPANIMTLPLVIGIGVTNGIHILNRFAEENRPGVLAKSTGKSVLVSGLTAIVGFGTLVLAGDRGLKSLGIVMSVGIAACMVAGLTFLPALLSILTRRGWTLQKKEDPVATMQDRHWVRRNRG